MPLSIESITTAALSAALEVATRRQAVVAANVANANAEGYVALRPSFDARLAELRETLGEGKTLRASDVDAISVQFEPASDGGRAGQPQLDIEMTELAANAVHFQALAQALSRHLGLLALAAGDGRR